VAPSAKVDQFCQKTGVPSGDLSNAETKLLDKLSTAEIDVLADIHTKSTTLKPIARVGSSGF
jgi:hypothetical protein